MCGVEHSPVEASNSIVRRWWGRGGVDQEESVCECSRVVLCCVVLGRRHSRTAVFTYICGLEIVLPPLTELMSTISCNSTVQYPVLYSTCCSPLILSTILTLSSYSTLSYISFYRIATERYNPINQAICLVSPPHSFLVVYKRSSSNSTVVKG